MDWHISATRQFQTGTCVPARLFDGDVPMAGDNSLEIENVRATNGEERRGEIVPAMIAVVDDFH